MWLTMTQQECYSYLYLLEEKREQIVKEDFNERITQRETECIEYPNHKIVLRETHIPVRNKGKKTVEFELDAMQFYLKDVTGNLMCVAVKPDEEDSDEPCDCEECRLAKEEGDEI